MARFETVLRVLIASPSDLDEERATVREVISELNNTWAKTIGIRLEAMGWESHATPGFGEDAQDVINQSFDDDYDIFIGMIWTRFGTPTHRAPSGTAEEFDRAYARFREQSDSLRIMFYFKEAPVAPSLIDAKQLEAIQAFRRKLGEKGGLYSTFTDEKEFASLLRMHLSRQVQDWNRTWGTTNASTGITTPSVINQSISKDMTDDEDGFLDLIEQGEDGIAELGDVMTNMTRSLEELAEQVNLHTATLLQIDISNDVRAAKRVVDRIASEMEQYATRSEVEVPLFKDAFAKFTGGFSKAVTLLADFGDQDFDSLESSADVISELENTISSTEGQIVSFRETIAGLPRASTRFKKAKRRTLDVLDQLIFELQGAKNMTHELNSTITALVETES